MTPGHTASLTGFDMRINSKNQEEGVFFISKEYPKGIKAERIISSTARNLVFLISEKLPAGAYRVKVRCGFGQTFRWTELGGEVFVEG